MPFNIEYADGRLIEYPDQHKQRVLYAITSLEMTPVLKDLGIHQIRRETGFILWPAPDKRKPPA